MRYRPTAAVALGILASVPGCHRLFSLIEVDDVPGVDAGADAAPLGDTPPSTGWGEPVLEIGFPDGEDDPSLSTDMLTIYFNRDDDIFVSTRMSATDSWGAYQTDMELSTGFVESTPDLSPDGLTMYLARDIGDAQRYNIYVAKRATPGDPWGAPLIEATLGTVNDDHSATIDASGLELAFASNGDVYTASRQGQTGAWSTPKLESTLTTGDADGTFLMADGLTLYLDLTLATGVGDDDLYVTTRATVDEPFGPPVLVETVNSTNAETDPWVSPDGRHLYFISTRGGERQLWHSQR